MFNIAGIEDAFISFNGNIKYELPGIYYENDDVEVKSSRLEFNIGIFPLLFGKLYIKNTKIDTLYLKYNERDTDDKNTVFEKLKILSASNVLIKNVNINNNIKLNALTINSDNNDITLSVNKGNFFLKEYFDYNINFTNLTVNLILKDDIIETLKVHSLMGEMDFYMQISNNNNLKELFFDLKNVPLDKLKVYWPNFIDKDVSRKWMLEHIIDGKSQNTVIKTTFYDDKMQDFHIKSEINNASLNYNDFFPSISDINGTAVFTKQNMNINVADAKVLNSKLSNVNVKMDFMDNDKNLSINGKVDGNIADIFIHIDKNNMKKIKKTIDNVIDDYNTITHLKIVIPIKTPNFKKTEISTASIIKNKKNKIFKDEKFVTLIFTKPKNTNEFFGNIELTQNLISHSIFYKKSGESLSINYACEVESGNKIKIKEIKTISNNLSISGGGYLDKMNFKINHNGSIFDLEYTPKTINIVGERLNLSMIDFDFSEHKKENDYSYFIKLNQILLKNDVVINEVNAKYDGKLVLNSDLLKTEDGDSFLFNDFGKIMKGVDFTDRISGGNGYLKIDKNKTYHINASDFNINIDENKDSKGDFYVKSIDGSFKINDNLLTFSNALLELKKNIEIITSGSFSLDTYKTDISGIIVFNPYLINSFTTIGLVGGGFLLGGPILGAPLSLVTGGALSKIFKVDKRGDKIFANSFTIYRKNKDSKIKFDYNKVSVFLPGFLRDLLF
jgi:hypothetical protein